MYGLRSRRGGPQRKAAAVPSTLARSGRTTLTSDKDCLIFSMSLAAGRVIKTNCLSVASSSALKTPEMRKAREAISLSVSWDISISLRPMRVSSLSINALPIRTL